VSRVEALFPRPHNLPDGLTWSCIERLKNYAERVIEHGIEVLGSNSIQIHGSTIERHFYLEALQLCRPLSTITVKNLCLMQAELLVNYFGSHQAEQTVLWLEAFYRGNQNLPKNVASRIDLVEGIETWAALSDLTYFANAFFTKRVPEPDSRGIGECLTRTLALNNLRSVFDLTRFTVFPGQDDMTANFELIVPLRPHGNFDAMMSELLDDRLVGKPQP
jgi:hypothetical protein